MGADRRCRGASCGCSTVRGQGDLVSTRSLALPLTYLRDIGVAAQQQTRPREDARAHDVAQGYRRYLREERGLAAETQRGYLRIAGRFCRWVPGGWGGPGRLGARDVSSYLVAASRGGSVAAAKKTVTALASLGHLFIAGVTAEPLRERLPRATGPVPSPRRVELDADAVGRLLAACDPRPQGGLRDRAVILVLARLGLRAGEVAALRLDDVDWHRGEVVIPGKGARLEPVPLPADVGQTVAAYLRGRPPAPRGCRSVFLRLAPPAGPITSYAVSDDETTGEDGTSGWGPCLRR